MKNSIITEAQLLLNQQVKVTSNLSQFTGLTGRVNRIMEDERTLDITLDDGGDVFLDVSLVGEIKKKPGHHSDGCCHEAETDEDN
tara:strand:- start:3091 stop:3345 length:255 start_codon:yes stop_codon:yes gene_type:complete